MRLIQQQGKELAIVKGTMILDGHSFKQNFAASNHSDNQMLNKLVSNERYLYGLNKTIHSSIQDHQTNNEKLIRMFRVILNQDNQVVQAFNNNSVVRSNAWKNSFTNDQRMINIVKSLNMTLSKMNVKLVNQMTDVFNAYLDNINAVRNNTLILKHMEENLNQSRSSILMSMKNLETLQKTNISHNNSLFHDLQYKKLIEIEMGKKILEYNRLVQDLVDEHYPIKTKQIKVVPQSPWFDSEYKNMRTLRRKAEKKSKKTKLPADKEAFVVLRKETTKLAMNKQKEYYKRKISECNGQKELFNCVNNLLDRKKDCVIPEHTSPVELAN